MTRMITSPDIVKFVTDLAEGPGPQHSASRDARMTSATKSATQSERNVETISTNDVEDRNDSPPIQPDQEWANALTHGIAAIAWIGLSVWMVIRASEVSVALAVACAAYGATVIGTFTCSTLSHTFLQRPLLDRFRAWDQAMIYLMIIGTYTPITVQFAEPKYRVVLLVLMWGFAFWGFYNKAIRNHRIHSMSTVTYLMLGWLPAIPLFGRVSMELFLYVLAGGVIYSAGVLFLINDRRVKYFHAVWHLVVMTASIVHFIGIVVCVIDVPMADVSIK